MIFRAGIQTLLRRCLTKDLKHRLRDIGDARHLIDETAQSGTAGASPTVRRQVACLQPSAGSPPRCWHSHWAQFFGSARP